MADVHIGCSGWSYRDWRGVLYDDRLPARRWLEAYAGRFDTVEINATFYRLPTLTAVGRWVEQTPPGFIFCVKASRYLTHVKRLVDIDEGIARFYERIEPLRAAGRLGPLLWQLPESFHRDDGRLHALLSALPRGRHAIEFRHPSWFVDDVLDELRGAGVALVIGDHPQRPFQLHAATAPWMLLRLHYGRRGRDGNYSARELDEWAARIIRWRRDHELYLYFNNDWRGFAPRNALLLTRKLAGAAPAPQAQARAPQARATQARATQAQAPQAQAPDG